MKNQSLLSARSEFEPSTSASPSNISVVSPSQRFVTPAPNLRETTVAGPAYSHKLQRSSLNRVGFQFYQETGPE